VYVVVCMTQSCVAAVIVSMIQSGVYVVISYS